MIRCLIDKRLCFVITVFSMNQVVAHLRGEVSRTNSFSSSVTGHSSPSLSVDRSSGGSASPNRGQT